MSRAIQTNDESRGPTVARYPNYRTSERRDVQSQDSPRAPRVGQYAGVRGGNSSNVICFKCNRPGRISRLSRRQAESNVLSEGVKFKKRGNKGGLFH